MKNEPPSFAKPFTSRMPLRVPPRLASWERSGHPGRVRLKEFLDHAEALIQPRLADLTGPLALWLDVGLDASVPLHDQHDLDNYLFPLAGRLARTSGRSFVSVWGSKRHAGTSYICVGPAVPSRDPASSRRSFMIRTTASSETTAYKRQIHDQVAHAVMLPEGPVSLRLGFSVGPRRNWLNLWKPTIDALDPILGSTVPGRPWHPRDGRVVELGLHCRVEPSLGNDVVIAVDASARESIR